MDVLEDLDVSNSDDRLHAPHWLGEMIRLSPSVVTEVLGDFAERAASDFFDNIRRSGVNPEHITHVLFAGGVCQSDHAKGRLEPPASRARSRCGRPAKAHRRRLHRADKSWV